MNNFIMDKEKEKERELANSIVKHYMYNEKFVKNENGKKILKDVSENKHENVYAEHKVFGNGVNKYYILCDSDGNIFNPFSSMEDNYTYDKDRGGPRWQMIEVPNEVFINYYSFLLTRNEAYLRNVDRSVRNTGI